MTRHRVADAASLAPGCMMRVEVGGVALCLAHVEGVGFRAIGDRCTHEDESLSEGELWGKNVECPAHGSRFDLTTGEVTGVPATVPAKVFDVVVEGDGVFVSI